MRPTPARWRLSLPVLAAGVGYVSAQQGTAPAVTSQVSTQEATVQAVYPDIIRPPGGAARPRARELTRA